MNAPAIQWITPHDLMELFNHTFPTGIDAELVVVKCPCGQRMALPVKTHPDTEVVICPRCGDWHYVAWKD